MQTRAETCTELDFPAKIRGILDLVRERPAMWPSPKRLEYQLCALLVAWEALTLRDAKSHHVLDIWQERCRRLHQGRADLTLADAVQKPGSRQRWRISHQEAAKAYQRVLGGLRQVYKGTQAHYEQRKLPDLALDGKAARILQQLIQESFRQTKSFANPEGLESYLLTLIGLFEVSLGQDPSKLISRELWREEIQRKRSLGPPATRTLADVTGYPERAERAKALLPNERAAILSQVTKSMQRLVRQLDAYLGKRSQSAN